LQENRAAYKQSGSHQEHHRQRDLTDDEHRTEPIAQCGRVGARAVTEYLLQVETGCTKCREHSASDAAAHGHEQREEQDRRVERCSLEPWHPQRIVAYEKANAEGGNADAEYTSAEGEDEILRQQLSDDSTSPGAERVTYGDLLPAHGGARQLQVSDVQAGDE
jgi:hypothetical protein